MFVALFVLVKDKKGFSPLVGKITQVFKSENKRRKNQPQHHCLLRQLLSVYLLGVGMGFSVTALTTLSLSPTCDTYDVLFPECSGSYFVMSAGSF